MAEASRNKLSAKHAVPAKKKKSSQNSTQRSPKNPHLNATMSQLKSALDEWSNISPASKSKKSIEHAEPVSHDALLKKTRKLLESLNRQLDDLSN